MKKIFVLLLCLSLFLAGCNSSTSSTNPPETDASEGLSEPESSEVDTTQQEEDANYTDTAQEELPTEDPTQDDQSETTEDIADPKVVIAGNIKIDLLNDQSVKDASENSTTFIVTQDVSAGALTASEINSTLGAHYSAAFQHSAWANPSNKTALETTYYFLSVAGTPVEFSLFTTTNGLAWLVGTFYDAEYVYTIAYTTSVTDSEEIARFTDILERVQEVNGDALEITGYAHS